MSFLEDNLRVLRSRFPGLAERLDDSGDDGELGLQLVGTPSGDPTVTAEGTLVHSGRDPRREGRRLAQGLSGHDPLVLLGFGLGYLGEALRNEAPDRPLVVVERRTALLRLALGARDLRGFLASGPLIFQAGGRADGIIAALQTLEGKPRLVANPALRSFDAPWYDEVERHVRAWNDKEEVNAATLKRFGRRWVRNLASNLPILPELPGIDRLRSCCAGLPALILAAGPSLDKILPALPSLAERCVVICVDTALRAALAAGVDPDFVLVVDPQYWNARHLDRCPAPRSCLISESAVHPAVLRHTFGRTYLCSSVFALGRFIEDRVDHKGVLGAGGSVATTAWDFARILGASPLWIAGLDLAFPDLKTHFHGALFEERVHGESCRLIPAETRSVGALRDGQPYYAPSAGGARVLTDKRLSLYASWFEGRFRLHPDSRPRSLAPGGLAIPGMELGSVEELTALPVLRPEIARRLSTTFERVEAEYAESREDRMVCYSEATGELHRGLEDLIRLAEGAVAATEAALENPLMEERNAAIQKLDAVQESVRASPVKDVAGFLFSAPRAEEPEMRTGDEVRNYLVHSARLFRALAESAGFTLRSLAFFRKARAETADIYTNGE